MEEKEPEINPVITQMVAENHLTAFSWECVNVWPSGEVTKETTIPVGSTRVLRVHILGELIAQYSFYHQKQGEKKQWLQAGGRLRHEKLTDDDWRYLGSVAAAGMFFQEIRAWVREVSNVSSLTLPARKDFGFRIRPRGHVTQLLQSKTWKSLIAECADKGLKLERPETLGGFVLTMSKPPVLVE